MSSPTIPVRTRCCWPKYKRMGELRLLRPIRVDCAREWMRRDPGKFAVITLRRVYYFWNGIPRLAKINGWPNSRTPTSLLLSVLGIWGLLLALKRRVHGVFLFASLLAFYPLVYYICFPEPRYRHPD